MPDLLFRSLADIDEAETANTEPFDLTPEHKQTGELAESETATITPFDLTPMPKKMPDLESKLRALLDEANAAGAFAGVGSVPVGDDQTKLEFYFTLRVPSAPQPIE